MGWSGWTTSAFRDLNAYCSGQITSRLSISKVQNSSGKMLESLIFSLHIKANYLARHPAVLSVTESSLKEAFNGMWLCNMIQTVVNEAQLTANFNDNPL